MNEKIENIIKRAKKLKDIPSLDITTIKNLEHKLDVCFSNDFIDMSLLFRYDYLSTLDFFSLETEDEYSVVGTTVRWRKELSLPKKYIALAEDGESIILMETQKNPQTPTSIIWCRSEDIDQIIDGKNDLQNSTIFHSFIDFLEFLLDEEEELRSKQ